MAQIRGTIRTEQRLNDAEVTIGAGEFSQRVQSFSCAKMPRGHDAIVHSFHTQHRRPYGLKTASPTEERKSRAGNSMYQVTLAYN